MSEPVPYADAAEWKLPTVPVAWTDNCVVRPPMDNSVKGALDVVYAVTADMRAEWLSRYMEEIHMPTPLWAIEDHSWLFATSGGIVFEALPITGIGQVDKRRSDLDGQDRGAGSVVFVDPHRAVPLNTAFDAGGAMARGLKYVRHVEDPAAGPGELVLVGGSRPKLHGQRSLTEVNIERELRNADWDVRPGWRFLRTPAKTWAVDIAVPNRGLVVEFDGVYFHSGRGDAGEAAKSLARDAAKGADLRAAGLRVVRIREGLDTLHDDDLAIPEGLKPHVIAGMLISHLATLGITA